MTHIKSFKSFINEVALKTSDSDKLQHEYVQGQLAAKDINSSMVGKKTIVVHKDNLNAAKKHLKAIGYHNDYSVVSESSIEEDLDKDSKEYLKDKLEVAKSRAKYGNFYSTKSFNKYSKQQYKKLDNSQFESVEEDLLEGFTTHKPESYTSDLEGSVTPIHKAKLSLLKGFDTKEDKDGYSPTHMIKCTKTGSLHTAYTRNGELRVRPYGKVSSGVTADLVKHLSSGITKEKAVRESEELTEAKDYTQKAHKIVQKHGDADMDHSELKQLMTANGIPEETAHKVASDYRKPPRNEEELDEVSKELLGRYIKKATGDSKEHRRDAWVSDAEADEHIKDADDIKSSGGGSSEYLYKHDKAKDARKQANTSWGKHYRREAGVSRAVDKLIGK